MGRVFPNTIQKPCGHGLWLALYRSVVSSDLRYYNVFSAAVLGLLPLLAFWFGSLVRSWRTGAVCAAFVMISPVCVYHSLLAEPTAAFLGAMAFVFTAAATRWGRIWPLLPSAVLAFWSYLARPDFLLYVPALLTWTFVRPQRTLSNSSETGGRSGSADALGTIGNRFIGAAAFVGVFAILMGGLLVSNAGFYGRAAPVRYDAYFRYYSVFQAHRYHVDLSAPEIRTIQESVVAAGILTDQEVQSAEFLGRFQAWHRVRVALQKYLGSWYAADATMDRAALGVIRANLPEFLWQSAETFLSFVCFQEVPLQRLCSRFGWVAVPTPVPENPGKFRPFDDEESVVWGSDLQAYHVGERLYEGLLSLAGGLRKSITIYESALKILFVPIYLGIGLLFWHGDRITRLRAAGMFASLMLVFAAYGTGGIFDIRYLASHCWPLWVLSGWGFSLFLEKLPCPFGLRNAGSHAIQHGV